jgi:hypothetical protein
VEKGKYIQNFNQKLLGNGHTWKGNIKMAFHRIDFEVMDVSYVRQDRVYG